MTTKSGEDSSPEVLHCDYLIVGGGATGLAFADTLLHSFSSSDDHECGGIRASGQAVPRVAIVDKHLHPGGQWNDSYDFVRLHQPSAMYGVESEPLEEMETSTSHEGQPGTNDPPASANAKTIKTKAAHRATRLEILAYYAKVVDKLKRKFGLKFTGGYEFIFSREEEEEGNISSGDGSSYQEFVLQPTTAIRGDDGQPGYQQASHNLLVRCKKLVDARWLEPDLPVFVPPKFKFDSKVVRVVAPNELSVTLGHDQTATAVSSGEKTKTFSTGTMTAETVGGSGAATSGSVTDGLPDQDARFTDEDHQNDQQKFVIIGAGKTGMDAVVYLQTVRKIYGVLKRYIFNCYMDLRCKNGNSERGDLARFA